MQERKPNAKALLPIVVFLVFYLGSGIYFEYINPTEGQMGFYVMSVVVSFVLALIVAFLQNPSLSFDEKIKVCAKGIGNENITIMLFIFLMAGMFSGVAKASGGADSTAYLLLDIIPAQFAIPSLFIIACLISMSMGTSVGTISVLVPIAVAVAKSAHLGLPFCVGTIVGGAMFGDNLSFISDTTIAATKTQGCEMKDKFKANFRIALPAALISLVILIAISMSGDVATIKNFDYNIWQALPYFLVLLASLCGINVFIVLGCGTVLSFCAGLGTKTLTVSTGFQAMGDGTSGMFETMVVAILVASMGELIKEYGGFEFILQTIKKAFNSRRGGMLGIGILTSLLDISTANNTVAIVMAGPIVKDISEEFDIDAKTSASLMDIFSCICQGLIPYGAQLLVASGIAKISSVSIMPFLYYQFLLLGCVLVSILFGKVKPREQK